MADTSCSVWKGCDSARVISFWALQPSTSPANSRSFSQREKPAWRLSRWQSVFSVTWNGRSMQILNIIIKTEWEYFYHTMALLREHTSSQRSMSVSASLSNGASVQPGILFIRDCSCRHTALNSSTLSPRPPRSDFILVTCTHTHKI